VVVEEDVVLDGFHHGVDVVVADVDEDVTQRGVHDLCHVLLGQQAGRKNTSNVIR
jgi:hypothetical protein